MQLLQPHRLWYRLRHYPIEAGTVNRLHLYFLYGGFRKGYEFWEAVVLARKFLVCRVLPPRIFSGADSNSVTAAPFSLAVMAAHSAALPPPATTTSRSDIFFDNI